MIKPFDVITEHEGNYETMFDIYPFVAIFKPVFDAYGDKSIAVKIIKFIGHGYSMESQMISVSGDRRKELNDIFDWLEIPKTEYTNVVLLELDVIRVACWKWLEFQDSAQLEYLFTLKQSYIQQQAGSLAMLKKGDTTATDYDQKHKCIEHMRELRVWITEAEQELIQNNPKLKEAYKEVGVDNTKTNGKNKGIEAYLREKHNK